MPFYGNFMLLRFRASPGKPHSGPWSLPAAPDREGGPVDLLPEGELELVAQDHRDAAREEALVPRPRHSHRGKGHMGPPGQKRVPAITSLLSLCTARAFLRTPDGTARGLEARTPRRTGGSSRARSRRARGRSGSSPCARGSPRRSPDVELRAGALAQAREAVAHVAVAVPPRQGGAPLRTTTEHAR